MGSEIVYERRKLSDKEIGMIIKEIREVPDITYVLKIMFKLRKDGYVATQDGKLCGICSFYDLGGNWVKLGPLLVLKEYRGRGIGSTLLTKVIALNENRNLYVGSSRGSLKELNKEFGFIETRGILLPFRVKLFFLFYFFVSISSLEFWREFIRKSRTYPKREYQHFLRKI